MDGIYLIGYEMHFPSIFGSESYRCGALRCAARVARGTEAEACILVRIPLHDELGEQLF